MRISRRVDQLVEPERLRRPERRLHLRLAQQRRLVLVRAPRPAHRRRAHRAHRRAREREHRRLAVEGDHAHDHRAEAVGLAQRHLELRRGGQRLRRVHARARPQDALPLRRAARASRPGCRTRKTSGRWNESATVMKCAALSAASASIEPASTCGWLATTATGWPPSRASAQMTERPKSGCTSNARPGVEHDVDHVVHVVDLPTVAGHEVEHLGHDPRLRRRRRRSTAGTTTPTTGSSAGTPRTRSSAPASSSAHVVDQPARERDRRAAEVLLRDRLAERLEHHRRAGREDRGACSLITVKSDIGATSAPWPADAPSTAVTSGTRPEQRACASRSVGVRAWARPSARKPGALEHHHQRHPVERPRSRRPGSASSWRPG